MLAVRDWSNRPFTGASAYSPEELQRVQAADWLHFAGRAVLSPAGAAFCSDLDGVVMPRVGLLHTLESVVYEDTAWDWFQREGAVLNDTALLLGGEPLVRWRGGNGVVYNTDPMLADPVLYADTLAGALTVYGFNWAMLDYFSENPWDFDNEQSLEVQGLTSAWQLWQRVVVSVLHSHGIRVCGNGRWAAERAEFLQLDALYLERMGALWWTPTQAINVVRAGWGSGWNTTFLDHGHTGPKNANTHLPSFAAGCRAVVETSLVPMETLAGG